MLHSEGSVASNRATWSVYSHYSGPSLQHPIQTRALVFSSPGEGWRSLLKRFFILVA